MLSFHSKTSILLAVLFSAMNRVQAGCCSMNYKQCDVSWCGSSKSECEICVGDLTYLEDGERTDCLARWSSCTNNKNACCDGTTCNFVSQYFSQCLPSSNNEIPVTVTPTIATTPPPTNAPTPAPTQTPSSLTVSPTESSPIIGSNNGCCSLDFKNCITWCGSTIDSCLSCSIDDGVIWLQDGSMEGTDCIERWYGCNKSNECCDGLTCRMRGDTSDGYMACLKPLVQTPTPVPSSSQNDIEWDGSDLVLTHYWDCSGQSCDATTLSPWNYDNYRSPSGYSPQDPNDFGGPSSYGEKLWVTAAIMNIDQGSDDGCCGSTSEGGCGNCVLIQNPDSLRPDWSVMAMKKNTCGNCGDSKHADINVPGFDVLQYSLANICGDQPNTGLTKDQSTILGEWYKTHSNTADAGGELCGYLPEAYQKGCYLFSDWGWIGGKTSRARYKVVDCPQQFKTFVGSLFDENGIIID